MTDSILFGLSLVDFHHKRGPEIEYWYGLPPGVHTEDLWLDMPFQALPDGSHSFEETFTYFTLLYNKTTGSSAPNDVTLIPQDHRDDYTTLFAISCSRQIKASKLLNKDENVTRSTVQKAIVIILRQPLFGQIKDKLSIVTNAFFMQHDFSNKTILNTLYDNLLSIYNPRDPATPLTLQDDNNLYVGLNLRRIIVTFKKNVLVLLKAMLLEKKIIIFGTNVEELGNLQFGLISLIPALMSNLSTCCSPLLFKPYTVNDIINAFKSSDKDSIHKFLGLPLQIFGSGGFFSPYTPLQQVDTIKSSSSKFFVVGTSNSLLFEQRAQLCDIFVNLNLATVEFFDKSLNSILNLHHHDKKWIESITDSVLETWDENDESFNSNNSQYRGSDDFIRNSFEEYITGLLCSAKLHEYINLHRDNENAIKTIQDEQLKNEPIYLYNFNWVSNWFQTENYKQFNTITDDRIFDLFPAKHPFNSTDPITIFQERVVTKFQNLKIPSNENRNKSNEKLLSSDEEKDETDINDNSNKDITEVASSSDSKFNDIASIFTKKSSNSDKNDNFNGSNSNNIWNQWKDYFNRKKNKNTDSPSETDASLVNLDDTSNVENKSLSYDIVETTHCDPNSHNGSPKQFLNQIKRLDTKKAIDHTLHGLGLYVENTSQNEIEKAVINPVDSEKHGITKDELTVDETITTPVNQTSSEDTTVQTSNFSNRMEKNGIRNGADTTNDLKNDKSNSHESDEGQEDVMSAVLDGYNSEN